MPRASLPVNGSVPVEPRVTCPESFGVQVSFQGDRASVAVRGELDGATVPTLRTVLSGLVDGGHHRIVLDLDRVTFLDAAGLGAMVATLERLRRADGSLVLRAVPPRVTRLLEITGLDANFDIEVANVDVTLRSDLARVATQPARNRAVDAQLSLVVALAEATIGGADGVSVTLERRGQLATVAATNDTVLRMDAHQYATGEGPCLSAAGEGRSFQIESLVDEERWPTFVPLAAGEGIASILSTPLKAAGKSIGALNVYSNAEAAFGTYQQELAGVLADEASRILASEPGDMSDEEMSARITDALRSRLILAQAQGVLMGRHRITADDATDALHHMARTAQSSVLENATTVIASTQRDVGPVEGLGNG